MKFDEWAKAKRLWKGGPYFDYAEEGWNAALAESNQRDQAAVEAERERCVVALNERADQWAHGDNPNATGTSRDIYGELTNAASEIRSIGPTPALDALLAEALDKALANAAGWLMEKANLPKWSGNEGGHALVHASEQIADAVKDRLRAAKEPHAG
jgi:hypothetical protein